MKQIIYVMQFSGKATPSEGSSSVLKAATTGHSCRLTTVTSPDGVTCRLEEVPGGQAYFDSEVIITGETSFREAGTIRFGSKDHSLTFSTVGEGYLGVSADPNLKHGTVTWRVDSGVGQFAEATGLITSNFTIGPNGEVTDNHSGVLFLK